ncbi:MAG: hypothetical protein GEU90_10975 [Gemmatimonas sp.]|nr:hypothetical protein [Gemmatimonas sp.]
MQMRDLVLRGFAAALVGAAGTPLAAQDYTQHQWPGSIYGFQLANVLPSGQPVIPVFEGWYPNPDGTKTLSFSYFNLNYEETLNIPIGPDNFIEPSQFDGMQPTHFMAAPDDRGRNNRHESVFTIVVPGDYTETVDWTLRIRGQTYRVRGRPVSEPYRMDDGESSTSSPVAATVKLDPNGPAAKGRLGVTHGPLIASVGQPLPLSVWVDPQPRSSSIVTWYHHQGPGTVTFSQPEVEIEGAAEVETTATFSEPGDYLLRVTAIENLSALVQHCCWTNSYVQVTVR